MKKYELFLPDFVYVPTVSPSAVAKRTRSNGEGVDINRSCFEESKIAEIEANFYLYDIGYGLGMKDSWRIFKEKLVENSVGLFNGEDDPEDPILDFTFETATATFRDQLRGWRAAHLTPGR